MKNAIKSARLIFRSISSAKSSILMILALGIGISFASSNATLFITYIVMMQVIMLSYPFAMGEKYGVDTLFSTLPLSRRDFVNGLYVYVLVVEAASMALILTLQAVLSVVLGDPMDFSGTAVTIGATSLIYSFGAAFSYPIFCGMSYSKARMLSLAPMMVFAVAVVFLANTQIMDMVFGGFFDFLKNPSTPGIIIAVSLPAGLAALGVSAALSHKLYVRRDL